MHLITHSDGSYSIGKNRGAGSGVVFGGRDFDFAELGYKSQYIEHATTPVAEYTGLICALELAHHLGATTVKSWMDAELIVRQVNQHYACRDQKLRPYLDYVWALMDRFERVEVVEFPRAGPNNKRRFLNARADTLAGECSDLGLNFLVIHDHPGEGDVQSRPQHAAATS